MMKASAIFQIPERIGDRLASLVETSTPLRRPSIVPYTARSREHAVMTPVPRVSVRNSP